MSNPDALTESVKAGVEKFKKWRSPAGKRVGQSELERRAAIAIRKMAAYGLNESFGADDYTQVYFTYLVAHFLNYGPHLDEAPLYRRILTNFKHKPEDRLMAVVDKLDNLSKAGQQKLRQHLAQDWTGEIKIYEPEVGDISPEPMVSGAWHLAFSPDGKALVAAGQEGLVSICDPTTGKPLKTLRIHHEPVHVLAFDLQGKLMATGDDAGFSYVWKFPVLEKVAKLDHPAGVVAAAFDPDGNLFSACVDGKIRKWDLESAQCVDIIPEAPAKFLAFHGKNLAVVSDSTIHLYQPGLKTASKSIDLPAKVKNKGARLRSDALVAWQSDGRFRVIDLRTFSLGNEIQVRQDANAISQACLLPDGKVLTVGTHPQKLLEGMSLRLWDIQTGRNIATVESLKTFWPACMDVSAAGGSIVVGIAYGELNWLKLSGDSLSEIDESPAPATDDSAKPTKAKTANIEKLLQEYQAWFTKTFIPKESEPLPKKPPKKVMKPLKKVTSAGLKKLEKTCGRAPEALKGLFSHYGSFEIIGPSFVSRYEMRKYTLLTPEEMLKTGPRDWIDPELAKELLEENDIDAKKMLGFMRAEDASEAYFVISLQENDFGHVYAWDHEQSGAFNPVADSLEEFFEMLIESFREKAAMTPEY